MWRLAVEGEAALAEEAEGAELAAATPEEGEQAWHARSHVAVLQHVFGVNALGGQQHMHI